MNNNFKKTLFSILKLCLLGVIIGMLGGLVGGAFALLLSFVADTRESASWIILLLPLGGIVTVALFKLFRLSDFSGTNEVLNRLKNNKPINSAVAPLLFICTAITHLFGGSAGKEGAALQMGSSIASSFATVFRLKDNERAVFVLSGMSAVFAGAFGTPLTAAIFVLEFKFNKKINSLALLPCFISAIISKTVAVLIGAGGKAIHLTGTIPFTFFSFVKILVLAIGLCLLGKVMCFLFHKPAIFLKNLISNPFLRITLGSFVIILLTAIIGNMRYNGSGMDLAIKAIGGNANWYDFILKMIFTAITLAVGFKGGEMVPTFCIGATFGCVFGSILGLNSGVCAALGFIGLFCCATNSPISAILLGIEMFGFVNLPYYFIVCIILWPLSVKDSLLTNRFFQPITIKKLNQCK